MRWIFVVYKKNHPNACNREKTNNISLKWPHFIILPNFSVLRCSVYEFLVFAVKQIWFSFMISVFFLKIIRYTEALQFRKRKNLNWPTKKNPEIMETWHVCVMEFQTPNFWDFHEKCLSRNHLVLFRTVFFSFYCWKYARSENRGFYLFVLPIVCHTQCLPYVHNFGIYFKFENMYNF